MQIKHRLAESSPKIISIMSVRIKKAVGTTLAVVFWVTVWHILASIANKGLMLKIPLPIETVKAFFDYCGDTLFWKSVGTSLLHIILGFVSAVILGSALGMLSGNSSFFKTAAAPIIHLIRSVPVAAFIILAWLWVPNAVLPSFISFLMVFPIVFTHIETGLLSVDTRLIEMGKVFGMSRFGIVKHIKMPTVLPQLRVACISGLGFAWKSGVAAEVICNPTGSIGALLSTAKTTIDYPRVFAIILTIVILSLILENIIKLLWRER